MIKNLKLFSAAFLTALYLIISLSASAETPTNSGKNNQLTISTTDCDDYTFPCPWDDPNTRDDDTCNCKGDGSGGPYDPPDDDE